MPLPSINAQINFQLSNNNIAAITRQVQSRLGGGAGVLRDINRQLETGRDFADNFGLAIGNSARKFSAFAAGTLAVSKLLNSLQSGVNELIKFDKEMVKLKQVTEDSTQVVNKMGKEILDLSTTYGISAAKLAQVNVIMAQAGIRGKDLTIVMEALAKTDLSATFESIEDTGEGLLAIMKQFEIPGRNVERVLDSINKVSKEYAIESRDIIEAAKKAGSVFASAGGSFEEFEAILTSVRATTRQSAESIASGMNTIFARIQRPQTIEYLRQFGIELENVEGQFVGPFEAIKKINAGLEQTGITAGSIKFAEVVEELGGIRQLKNVVPLLQNTTLAMEALEVAQKKSAGSLDKDMKVGLESVSRQMEILRAEFNKLIIDLKDVEGIKLFAVSLLRVATALVKVADAAKEMAPFIAGLALLRLGPLASQGFRGRAAHFADNAYDGPPRLADGGKIKGGTPGVDSVNALLMADEFVINKKAAKSLGFRNLEYMNETGQIPKRFASGGQVAGGVLTAVGIASAIGGHLSGDDKGFSDLTTSFGALGAKVALAIAAFNYLVPTVRTGYTNLRELSISFRNSARNSRANETRQERFNRELRTFTENLRHANVSNDRIKSYARTARRDFVSGSLDPEIAVRTAEDRFNHRYNRRGRPTVQGRLYSGIVQDQNEAYFNGQRQRAANRRQNIISGASTVLSVGTLAAGSVFDTQSRIASRNAQLLAESGDVEGTEKAIREKQTADQRSSALSTLGSGVGTGALIGSAIAPVIGTAIGGLVGGIAAAGKLFYDNVHAASEEAAEIIEGRNKAFEAKINTRFNTDIKNINEFQELLKKTTNSDDARKIQSKIDNLVNRTANALISDLSLARSSGSNPDVENTISGIVDVRRNQLESGRFDDATFKKLQDELIELQFKLKISSDVIGYEVKQRESLRKALALEDELRVKSSESMLKLIDSQKSFNRTINAWDQIISGVKSRGSSARLNAGFVSGDVSSEAFSNKGVSITDLSKSGTIPYKKTLSALEDLESGFLEYSSLIKKGSAEVELFSTKFKKISSSSEILRENKIKSAISSSFDNIKSGDSNAIKDRVDKALKSEAGLADPELLNDIKEIRFGKEAKALEEGRNKIEESLSETSKILEQEVTIRKSLLDAQVNYASQISELALSTKREVTVADLSSARRNLANTIRPGSSTGNDVGDLGVLSRELLSTQRALQKLKTEAENNVVTNEFYITRQAELIEKANNLSQAMEALSNATDEAKLAIEEENNRKASLRGAASELAFGGRQARGQFGLSLEAVRYLQSGGSSQNLSEGFRGKVFEFLQKFGNSKVFRGESGNDIINRETALFLKNSGYTNTEIINLLNATKPIELQQLEAMQQIVVNTKKDAANGGAVNNRFFGGPVTGGRRGARDDVRLNATTDEFVINKDSALAIGHDKLRKINKTGKLPNEVALKNTLNDVEDIKYKARDFADNLIKGRNDKQFAALLSSFDNPPTSSIQASRIAQLASDNKGKFDREFAGRANSYNGFNAPRLSPDEKLAIAEKHAKYIAEGGPAADRTNLGGRFKEGSPIDVNSRHVSGGSVGQGLRFFEEEKSTNTLAEGYARRSARRRGQGQNDFIPLTKEQRLAKLRPVENENKAANIKANRIAELKAKRKSRQILKQVQNDATLLDQTNLTPPSSVANEQEFRAFIERINIQSGLQVDPADTEDVITKYSVIKKALFDSGAISSPRFNNGTFIGGKLDASKIMVGGSSAVEEIANAQYQMKILSDFSGATPGELQELILNKFTSGSFRKSFANIIKQFPPDVQDNINSLPKFYNGGIVGGSSKRDSNIISANKGEGVLKNSAMNKIGPEAFKRLNQTGSLPGIEGFQSAVQALQKAPSWLNDFRSSVEALASTSIKAELAPVSVSVRIIGAEILATIDSKIKEAVGREIVSAVSSIYHSDGTGSHSVRR